MRLCPSTPRFLLPQQIELVKTVHASAAEFFMQCGEQILANWFVHFAPHSITRETAFQHFFENNGSFFRPDLPLKKFTQMKRLKNCQFENTPGVKFITFTEGSNLVGSVLIGSWLFDVREQRPRHANRRFFKHPICHCHQLSCVNQPNHSHNGCTRVLKKLPIL